MKKADTSTLVEIDKPITILNSEDDIQIRSKIRFKKQITLEGFSGIIICPKEVFFNGNIVFKNCECHIICEEEPNILGQIVVNQSTISLEGVPPNYVEQLSEAVLKIHQSKIYI